MITSKKTDGTYGEIGFIKAKQDDGSYKDIEYQYDNKGNFIFEKGFTRSKEGVLPLVINGIGKPLKDYSIYGNTYQADGVSPDTPQEVVGSGDRTGNLFDKNDCTVEGYINLNGNISEAAHWFTTENYIKCSGTITITALNGLGSGAYITCYDEQKNLLGVCRITDTNQNQATINLIDGTKYIKTCCRDDNFDSFMLNSGSTPLPYEPYGYKADVECRGKNLFDFNSATFPIVGRGGVVTTNDKTVKYTLSEGVDNYGFLVCDIVLSKGSYTIFADVVDNRVLKPEYGYGFRVQVDGNFISIIRTKNSFTISAETSTVKIYFYTGMPNKGGGYVEVSNIQLELGTEATSYEPFWLSPKNARVIGIQPTTNYAYFDKKSFGKVAVGDTVQITAGSTSKSLKVNKIDDNYVYVENTEV